MRIFLPVRGSMLLSSHRFTLVCAGLRRNALGNDLLASLLTAQSAAALTPTRSVGCEIRL